MAMRKDPDMPPPGPDKATDRLLTVFETIAQTGPVPLAKLTETTGLPRSAVHRAAQVLQRRGWVRARLSDHAYAVSSRFDDAIANARYSHEEAETLAPIMSALATTWHCWADLGVFSARGRFEVVDSTDRRAHLGTRSLITSQMAVAAQISLPPTGRVRHLDAFLNTGTDQEVEFVTSGRHFQQLRTTEAAIAKSGTLVEPDVSAIAPFAAQSGSAGAVRLRPRGQVDLIAAATDIRRHLDGLGYTITPGSGDTITPGQPDKND